MGEALDDEAGLARALDLLLLRPGLDPRGRAAAHLLRGREWRHEGEYARALEECDRAIELTPDSGVDEHNPDYGYIHQMIQQALHPPTSTPTPSP